jgi:hypothetical protein
MAYGVTIPMKERRSPKGEKDWINAEDRKISPKKKEQ